MGFGGGGGASGWGARRQRGPSPACCQICSRSWLRQTAVFGQLTDQLALERAIGQGAPQRAGLAGHAGAAFGGGQVAVGAGRVDQKTRQGHGFFHRLGKGFAAVGADEAVGVVLGGQEQEFDAARVGGQGQGGIQRLAGGAAAGAVAVEAEDHLVGEAEQLLHVVGRAGRAQRGHGVGKAQLGQGDHVHVALGDQGVAGHADGRARFKQAVELAAFAEHRGFGRVQVFGFTLVEHAPAKADAFALDVADREHDAVAEAVVALGFAVGTDFVGVFDHQARLDQQGIGVVGEHAGQRAPAFGGVAQAKGLGDFAREAAALEVARRRAA